jgi:hypothetical protein
MALTRLRRAGLAVQGETVENMSGVTVNKFTSFSVSITDNKARPTAVSEEMGAAGNGRFVAWEKDNDQQGG